MALSKSLRSLDVELTPQTFSEKYISAFNRVFGEKHFSISSFLRCALISFLSVAILFSFWRFHLQSSESEGNALIGVLFLAAFLNVLPDYVSIRQTRWVLAKLSGVGSMMQRVAWIIVDVVLTALIFFFVSGLVVFAAFLPTSLGVDEWYVPLFLPLAFFMTGFEGPLGPMPELLPLFFSTFVTSLWIWLFAIGQFLLGQKNIHSPLLFLLPIDVKPMRSIGLFLGFLTAVGLVIFSLITSFFG